MKKAQSLLEYVLFLILMVNLCVLISNFWDRNTVVQSGLLGVFTSGNNRNEIEIPPPTE